MPKAPPVRSIEMVTVPMVSNLPKPYGYFSEGGRLDNFQDASVTKSPKRSNRTRGEFKGYIRELSTYHLMNDLHLRAEQQSSTTRTNLRTAPVE